MTWKKLLITLFWITGTLWIALVAAYNRAGYFGFQFEMVPRLVGWTFLFSLPTFVPMFLTNIRNTALATRLSLAMLFTGFLIGTLYVQSDDYRFRQEVTASEIGDHDRARAWPLLLWSLTAIDHDCYAYEE